MKRIKQKSVVFLLSLLLWNIYACSSSENELQYEIETTQIGSLKIVMANNANNINPVNGLAPEGISDILYICDGKLLGNGYSFSTATYQTLANMTSPESINTWMGSVTLFAKQACWVRHTSKQRHTYIKLRFSYMTSTEVGVEYLIDSTEDIISGEEGNENANSPIEGKSFVTDYSMPHLNPANYYVEHTVNYNNQDILNYAYEWIDSKKHTAWVAFSFDNTTSQQKFNRPDEEPWSTDPNLPEGMSPQESNHKNDGFDKGHICASADRLYDITANAQTFYYSNMSPQMTSFNGGYWITLEGLIQKWARSGEFEKMYVTKGGTMNELLVNFTGTQAAGDSKIPTTDANGFTKNGLACPKYYFIAVLAEKSGQYQSIGFLVEHRDDYGYSNSKQAPVSVVKQHSISIDELEQKTELDFFCNLPDIIENQVESSFNETDWNF